MVLCNEIEECRYLDVVSADKPKWLVDGFKSQYCCGEFDKCARRVVAKTIGRGSVPVDLGPHESMKAVRMMETEGQTHAARHFL